MLSLIVFVVLLIVAGILIKAAVAPQSFRVARAVTIRAPAEKVFAMVADFHQWPAWSPWEKYDPAMKKTYSGAAAGQGAVYEWDGNSKAGAGRSEITEAVAPVKIVMQLDFQRPFKARNIAAFTFDEKDGGTVVTWIISGPRPFIARLFNLLVNCDRMIGREFDAGLASLQALAENK